MAGSEAEDGALTHLILQIVADQKGPAGAGTIQLQLRRSRLQTSPATVGRQLRELEVKGLLAKVGVEGRRITPKGRQVLAGLNHESRLRDHGELLLGALRSGKHTKRDALALLAARRPIEVEIARLAASKATAEQIRRMQATLRKQHDLVAEGELADEADITFHEILAESSGNQYLQVITSLLRRHGGYSRVITEIRRRSGGELVVDHHTILEAVAAHDPRRAAQAADKHMAKLTAEVEQYWSEAEDARS
jgi:DNA-binding MarR family transcriptional regulator